MTVSSVSRTDIRPLPAAAAPAWPAVLRTLREARGLSQDGFAAQLGVGRTTVQRWEYGALVPNAEGEAALLVYCRERGLFRTFTQGPLRGLTVTADGLQALLAEARMTEGATRSAPAPSPSPIDAPAAGPGSNLPAALTHFIGRAAERATVRRLLGETRLLTLTGAGGCGKTRLALAVATELLGCYPDGVWFVELAALTDPALVPQAVAQALALRAMPGRPLTETLTDYLRNRRLLLLLDNCEHLAGASAELVETLLRACPMLTVLATSRASLGVAGEMVWCVPLLSLPSSSLAAADADAVRLFVDRARRHRPEVSLTADDEAAMVAICRRLDGIPLAIELAAARMTVLSVQQIAAGLEDRLHLLTAGGRGAPARHRTLRATLDWSYDLLEPDERRLMQRLATFAGGFSLDAVAAVWADGQEAGGTRHEGGPGHLRASCLLPPASDQVLDLLAALVDQSLVIADHEGEQVRYRLLETVRQYAGERLTAAEETAIVSDRHLAWCLALAETAAREFHGPQEPAWLERLAREHDNLRAALRWSLAGSDASGASALRLAAALTRFWEVRGFLEEGRRWLGRALAGGAGASATVQARALHSIGVLAYLQGDYAAARHAFAESLALYRALGDRAHAAEAQGNLGRAVLRLGEHPEAHALLLESLARHTDLANRPGMASVQGSLGLLALRQGDYSAARARLQASLALQRDQGNTEGIATALEDLATVAGEMGDTAEQTALLEESLAGFRAVGSTAGIALVLGNLGMAAWLQGDRERAEALLQESLALYRQVGDRRGIARVLANQAFLALQAGACARAAALCPESLALYRDLGDAWALGRYLPVAAGVALASGRAARAVQLFGAAAVLRERLAAPLPPVVQPAHDRAVAAARAALGDDRFTAAWAAGVAMAPHEAVNIALDESPPV